MYCVQSVTPEILYVGASDRRLALFENVYPIPKGVSYNSYLVLDEKTVLLDTADKSVSERFFENVAQGLNGRKLDYVIVNHMEPDHCATLAELLGKYPEAQVVATAKAIAMIAQFFDLDLTGRTTAVKEGDTLSSGSHTFRFVTAPMVHWPEVMVTYDEKEKILFSADAFGTFGALSGNLFADQASFPLEEYRRYYTNIVGKYGTQVQALLKKAAGLEIRCICPLHGPILRKELGYILDKYQKWSGYVPEEKGVVIFSGCVYGHTDNAAEIVANRLAEKGVQGIALYDAAHTHVSELLSEAFRCSHLVFAASTYNAGIFTPMETLLLDLKAHNLQGRKVALIESGSWALSAGKQMREIVESMKNMTVLGDTLSFKSSVKEDSRQALEALADAVAADVLGE